MMRSHPCSGLLACHFRDTCHRFVGSITMRRPEKEGYGPIDAGVIDTAGLCNDVLVQADSASMAAMHRMLKYMGNEPLAGREMGTIKSI